MTGPRPELAVGAVVVHDGRLLLVRRGREPARGLWSVPGGRVEGGESMAEAVVREVAEETGLTVRCGPFVGWVERLGPAWHGVILDFRAELVATDQVPVAGDDADAVAWVALDQLSTVELVTGLAEFLAEHGVTA